ncbi:hypothetical protein [Elizabethkingia sp. JS20170427COW]|uniref:hypothetical protein n=1 Tax=Elizabethkingia sp. JS20170427COW TaxID=2583851 RepID=UPI00111046BA|nr:hypothetical protein [Elizabethkingia sp. JS20170427COW]QCX53787.1 hypothetical protein FGE20_08615 [Elizabethkingia sp. JS20170427COW]
MKIREQHTRLYLINFLIGVYTFVVFFSGFLHTHQPIQYQDAGSKYEKVIPATNSDCLSCHLLGELYTGEFKIFQWDFTTLSISKDNIYFYRQDFFLDQPSSFLLRGPPVIF